MGLSNYQKHHIDASIRLDFPDPAEEISLSELISSVSSFKKMITQPEVSNTDFFTTQNTLKNPFSVLDSLNDGEEETNTRIGEVREYIIDFANSNFSKLSQKLKVSNSQIGFDRDALLKKLRNLPFNHVELRALSIIQTEAMEDFNLNRLQAAAVNVAKITFLEMGVSLDSGILENPEIDDSHIHLYLELNKPDRRATTTYSPTQLFDKIKELTADEASKLTNAEHLWKTRYLVRRNGLTGRQALGVIEGTNRSSLWLLPNLDEERQQRQANDRRTTESGRRSRPGTRRRR